MAASKLRVIQDFEKLPRGLQEQIREMYPDGFTQHLISFTNKDGKLTSALPFETEDKIYLVRMSFEDADLAYDEEEYDDDGILIKEAINDKKAKEIYHEESDIMDDDEEEDDDIPDVADEEEDDEEEDDEYDDDDI